MDFLGIGLPELIAVFIIVLLVLGPNEIAKVGKTIGRFIRNINTSEDWKALKRLTREIRTLPNRLAREAELDEIKKQFDEDQTIAPLKEALNLKEDLNLEAWTSPPVKPGVQNQPGKAAPDAEAPSPSKE